AELRRGGAEPRRRDHRRRNVDTQGETGETNQGRDGACDQPRAAGHVQDTGAHRGWRQVQQGACQVGRERHAVTLVGDHLGGNTGRVHQVVVYYRVRFQARRWVRIGGSAPAGGDDGGTVRGASARAGGRQGRARGGRSVGRGVARLGRRGL